MPADTNPDVECKEFAVLIPLTNGGHAMIDLEDYDRVTTLTWYRFKGYVRHVFNDNSAVWLHRFILGLETHDPRQTDHKNRNKLDNRRDNLRIATIQQNAVNRMPARPRLYRGVRYVAPRRAGSRAWYARAGLTYLGSFFTAEEAARAYDAKALELYGEFAILNFPQEHQHG